MVKKKKRMVIFNSIALLCFIMNMIVHIIACTPEYLARNTSKGYRFIKFRGYYSVTCTDEWQAVRHKASKIIFTQFFANCDNNKLSVFTETLPWEEINSTTPDLYECFYVCNASYFKDRTMNVISYETNYDSIGTLMIAIGDNNISCSNKRGMLFYNNTYYQNIKYK